MGTSRVKWRLTKVQLAVVGAGAVVLLLLGYALWSAVVWREARVVVEDRRAVITDMESVIFSSKTSRDARIAALRHLKEEPVSCRLPALVVWQSSAVKVLKQRRAACDSLGERAVKIQLQAQATLELLEDIDKVVDVAVKLKLPTTSALKEGDFARVAQDVDRYLAELDTLKVHGDAESLKNLAVGRTKDLKTAWSKLVEVNGAQRRAEFDAAVGQVEQAYRDMGGVDESARGAYVKQLQRMEASFK